MTKFKIGDVVKVESIGAPWSRYAGTIVTVSKVGDGDDIYGRDASGCEMWFSPRVHEAVLVSPAPTAHGFPIGSVVRITTASTEDWRMRVDRAEGEYVFGTIIGAPPNWTSAIGQVHRYRPENLVLVPDVFPAGTYRGCCGTRENQTHSPDCREKFAKPAPPKDTRIDHERDRAIVNAEPSLALASLLIERGVASPKDLIREYRARNSWATRDYDFCTGPGCEREVRIRTMKGWVEMKHAASCIVAEALGASVSR